MTDAHRLLVISPVRNEAAHIERVARSMGRQTRPPDTWLVVDDRSDDETPARLAHLARELPFMVALSTPDAYGADTLDRLAVAAEARAFNWALDTVAWRGYTHVGKLDGDIELPEDYFERILAEFDRDPALGIGGGVLVEQVGGRWQVMRTAREHVRGALKLYRRECFEAIGGIQERLGWDGIDQTYARMAGYRTRSFDHVVARHLRPVGTTYGALRGNLRGGETHYVLCFSPAWVLLKAVRYGCRRPYGVSGAVFLYGYGRARRRRVPRVEDPAYRRFVRRDERRRAAHRLGLGRADPA
ncbi:MAG: glycosyl transferase, family 2 [Solirubrobacterales bacterium]|nr:glycosyl transferase, family 2 [Solirubrobacterales bacterium]